MTPVEMVEKLTHLICAADDNRNMPCDHFDGGKTASCCVALDIEWGRPLTKREYDGMCSACRAYWHLQAARNDIIEHMRTR